jgi:hypothetical protein
LVKNREELMTQTTIDHLVIGAAELDKATKQIQDFIKADFLAGGKHPLMATHNRLIKLQHSLYMEIIAADPSASLPKNSTRKNRWFSLDSNRTQNRLSRAPQPLCWVVAVNDIEKTSMHCGYNPGRVIEMTRGNFSWKITISENGDLPESGILPIFIEWPHGKHPTKTMPESNMSLEKLTLFHPHPSVIKGILSKLNINGPIKVNLGEPKLQFTLKTPDNISVVFGENCLVKS